MLLPAMEPGRDDRDQAASRVDMPAGGIRPQWSPVEMTGIRAGTIIGSIVYGSPQWSPVEMTGIRPESASNEGDTGWNGDGCRV